jgi:uncharacterized protein (DUF934 family)
MEIKKQIIKDGLVIDDNWTLIDSSDEVNVSEIKDKSIVPIKLWQKNQTLHSKNLGILLNNNIDLTLITEELTSIPIIAIDFPSFMDGRGFSIARLLRERYGYKGEIRAVGYVIRDQLYYLKRCGFNAFSFNPENISGTFNLAAIATSLNDFTNTYQTSVDTPMPLFRRRS